MRLGEVLSFRKELYFEGAVQADWFYSPEKSALVSENFVFHGKQYFGIEEQGVGNKKRIATVDLVKELAEKLNDEKSNALSLAIADYGTGKSHLAVTLAQILSGCNYMPETYNKIINNIEQIDTEAAREIKSLTKGRNFVMVINGMKDFNLHSELLKSAQRSLKLYGLPDDGLKKINRAIETAELFYERNAISAQASFEEVANKKGWYETGTNLYNKIREKILTDEDAFDIVNEVYAQINGQEIRWDEGLSASNILEMLVSEYCGMNGIFDHIIILFDEFGRYLEYTTGVNAAKSGESALQQIFEMAQQSENTEGYIHVINFIQRDIKAYLETVDQTKNISKYIGRYEQSEKYYISSNLETVFANLIQRTDKAAFQQLIVSWQDKNENIWKSIFNKMNRWLQLKGIWRDYKLFRKVVIEGIYPLHPISTFMLTNLSDYLQNRSSLTLISRYIDDYAEFDIEYDPLLILPEKLISGDLYIEMLSAEQEGRQKTQQCIKYDNVLRKFEDKLSENSLKVLRSNLILRILRFRTSDYDDIIDAISLCSGLTEQQIREELKWLEDEYAILEYDAHAGVFDFTEESNGAHDFKIIKKRMMQSINISKEELSTPRIQDLFGMLEVQTTNFSARHKITTNEWLFKQEFYAIEDFTEAKANVYIRDWEAAITSTAEKGKLLWLYVNKDTDREVIVKAQSIVRKFEDKPIVAMLINDADNRLYEALKEYMVLDEMNDDIRSRYSRHFQEDYMRAEKNLRDEFDSLKKKRQRLTADEIVFLSVRMPIFLTEVFETIYPKVVPFFFDGFITKANNISGKAGGYYCSFIKMFLSNSVNEAMIHNVGVEMRNRIAALFFTTTETSWKCINENCSLVPPMEKNAKYVYNEIVESLNANRSIKCKDIYDVYCKPPYGMSEEIVTLMIAVICANFSYCIRVEYQEIKNLNVWKDEVITGNDKKIELNVVKKSTLMIVDTDAVMGKYIKIFESIEKNKNIFDVQKYQNQLEEMKRVDEIPEELSQRYLLAVKILETGKRAHDAWLEAIYDVKEQFNEAIENDDLYNAVKALEILRNIPIIKIFNENGFEYDDNLREDTVKLSNEISKYIEGNIDRYVSNMYCRTVEGINTFRNHNTKMETKLKELGFSAFAEKISKRKDQELNNVAEIKSREELRNDLSKYMKDSSIDNYVPYTMIVSLVKKGREIMVRVEKYKKALGKDANTLIEKLENRVTTLIEQQERIKRDIVDIWEDLDNVEDLGGIEELEARIPMVLQRGILPADKEQLEELQSELKEVNEDLNAIKNEELSRKNFIDKVRCLQEKYAEKEMEFEVLRILDKEIQKCQISMDEKEATWKLQYLSLGDETRESIHKWKRSVEHLPVYLSEDTLKEVNKLKDRANQLISKGMIEDVIYYFDKLSADEKLECIKSLQNRI